MTDQSNLFAAKPVRRFDGRVTSLAFEPAARSTDPESSHEAAEAITASGARGSQCRHVLGLLRAAAAAGRHNSTVRELVEISRRNADSLDTVQITRRLKDLEDNLLVECDRDCKRVCSISGARRCTWSLASEGRRL